jgi:hypothetical protein
VKVSQVVAQRFIIARSGGATQISVPFAAPSSPPAIAIKNINFLKRLKIQHIYAVFKHK